MHIPPFRADAFHQPPQDEPSTDAYAPLQAKFSPLVGLVMKGTLLSILTMGIYRFWYRTNLRRYYWNNTRLLGDGFEYTGTGRELFMGFLIALAVIIPISIGTSVLPWLFGPVVGAVVSTLVSTLLLPVLFQIMIFRARRYRLARTRFRGVRFSQGGSGLGYLWVTLKWLFITMLTLGVTMPYFRTALERYRIENTAFGAQKATFEAKAGGLMKLWLLNYMLLIGSVAVALWLAYLGKTGAVSPQTSLLGGGIIFIAFLLMSVLWFYYRAAEFRTFTNGTRFGDVSLSSTVTGGGIMRGFIVYAVCVLLMLGAFIVVFLLVTGGAMAAKASSNTAVIWIGLMFFVGFIMHAIIFEVMLKRRLWRIFVQSLTVHNTPALQQILNSAVQDVGGFGEAFDTGYDFAS
jgi:uncharacterized membrane protein YjgN (DUF898 family)